MPHNEVATFPLPAPTRQIGPICYRGNMSDHPILREAEFSPKVKTYWLLSPSIALACSIVLIPIIPFFLLIAYPIVGIRLKAMSCTLTERTLDIRQGVFNRVESTVPLDKVTDLQMFQGPVMRALGIHGFRVETAGQSSGPGGHLVNMIGIVNTPDFRKAVLAQRDALAGNTTTTKSKPSATANDSNQLLAVANDIRSTLQRIEQHLASK